MLDYITFRKFDFRLRTRMSLWFTWCIRLEYIYFMILLVCFYFGLLPPIVHREPSEAAKPSFSGTNHSSTLYTPYEWKLAGKIKHCFLIKGACDQYLISSNNNLRNYFTSLNKCFCLILHYYIFICRTVFTFINNFSPQHQ